MPCNLILTSSPNSGPPCHNLLNYQCLTFMIPPYIGPYSQYPLPWMPHSFSSPFVLWFHQPGQNNLLPLFSLHQHVPTILAFMESQGSKTFSHTSLFLKILLTHTLQLWEYNSYLRLTFSKVIWPWNLNLINMLPYWSIIFYQINYFPRILRCSCIFVFHIQLSY